MLENQTTYEINSLPPRKARINKERKNNNRLVKSVQATVEEITDSTRVRKRMRRQKKLNAFFINGMCIGFFLILVILFSMSYIK